MNNTHIHLILNHFPILGTLIGTVLLMYGVGKRNISIQKVSLVTIFIMSLIAIPVFITGEPAEESIENLSGVMESITEKHEEAAEVAFWLMMATGVVSILSVVMQMLHIKMAKTFVLISLLLSIITSGLMARTGYLGGQIRHTEIRENTTSNPATEQAQEKDDD